MSGRLRVPTGGELSLSAATIEVPGMVLMRDGRNRVGPAGDISLSAVGDIELTGQIRARSPYGPAAITLDAGGNVNMAGRIKATGYWPGPVTLNAGADINVDHTIRTRRRSPYYDLHPAGSIVLNAPVGNINVRGRIISGRPQRGGIILSASGNIGVEKPLASTTVSVDAGGLLTVAAPVRGSSVLRGAAGVTLDRLVDCYYYGCDVEVSSSAGGATVNRVILAPAGTVTVSASNDVIINDIINVSGMEGLITISSTSGNVTLNGDLFAHKTPGSPNTIPGDVVVTAGGTVTMNRVIRVDGEPGGTIRFEGSAVEVSSSARLNAKGGNAEGGIIEGTASGDLTASGQFECAGSPDGCIALSAGGTLDTTGATFDKAPVADCPGSPSRAFLDASDAVLD